MEENMKSRISPGKIGLGLFAAALGTMAVMPEERHRIPRMLARFAKLLIYLGMATVVVIFVVLFGAAVIEQLVFNGN